MQKKIISERALVGRMQRKLAHENQFLKVIREDARGYNEIGRFAICDGHSGNFVDYGITLAELQRRARELGVMHSDEAVAS